MSNMMPPAARGSFEKPPLDPTKLLFKEKKMIKKTIVIITICGSLVFMSACRDHNSEQAQTQTDEKKIQTADQTTQKGHQHRLRKRERAGRVAETVEDQVIHLSDEVKKQIDIKTTTVKPGPVKSTLKAMGTVLAPNDKKAIVGFAFSARIVKLHASVGQWVEKDQPLVTLECEEMGNAQSEFVKALTDCELSKLDFDREERLFKKDIGAKKDYLETKARYQIACASLNAAEKKLIVLGLSKKQIEEISQTKSVSPRVTLNAPISGRVVKNTAVLGAVIDASTEIMVIMDLGNLWIDAEIYEKDLSKVNKGQEVEIAVPAYPTEDFSGHIHYIGDVVNPDTRTITVRTKVINKDFKLKPGMFADIKIMTGHKENAIIVPKDAVLDDGDQKIVFVQDVDRFILRQVEVGTRYNSDIEILKGLTIGELVVVEGNYQLKSRLHEEALKRAHVH